MKCIKCGEEFEAKRQDAKYCSDACRKADKRNVRDNLSEINEADNVRDNLDTIPDPHSVIPIHLKPRTHKVIGNRDWTDSYIERLNREMDEIDTTTYSMLMANA